MRDKENLGKRPAKETIEVNESPWDLEIRKQIKRLIREVLTTGDPAILSTRLNIDNAHSRAMVEPLLERLLGNPEEEGSCGWIPTLPDSIAVGIHKIEGLPAGKEIKFRGERYKVQEPCAFVYYKEQWGTGESVFDPVQESSSKIIALVGKDFPEEIRGNFNNLCDALDQFS